MNYKILVIVVTYNAMRWVDKCLGSIQTSSLPADAFILDNGSTDGTQNYIKQNYPGMHFEQSERNLGFGQANNVGLRYALNNRYEYVYLLNQDAWLHQGTLEALISAQLDNPEYGILSPMQLQGNGEGFDNGFKGLMCIQENLSEYIQDSFFGRLNNISYE